MNRRTLIWTIIFIALLAAIFLIGNQLLSQLETSWPTVAAAIVLLLVALSAAINLLANLNDATDFVDKLTGRTPLTLKPEQEQRLRQALINRMQTRCREELKNQLQEAIWKIELGLAEIPAAVYQPRTLQRRTQQGDAQPLPTGTAIHTVFQELGGSLLILGQPGAGKTTTLLELAQELLQADADSDAPIPLYFNLASWATQRLALKEWIIGELAALYGVNKRLAAAWLQDTPYNITLLLDGLDEVKREHQADCVRAINTFNDTYGPIKTAVCCRVNEYDQLQKTTPLHFPTGSAIIIQPLKEKEIDQYLAAGGASLQYARDAVQTNPWLRDLAATPLFLNVIAFAFRSRPVTITEGNIEQQLWAAYIQRAFQQRELQGSYTPEQATHWLTYLATQLIRLDLTEFYIERLQPFWFPRSSQINIYRWCAGLFVGLIVWVLFFLMAEPSVGLGIALSYGLVPGLLFGRVIGRYRIHFYEKFSFKRINWKVIQLFLMIGMLMGALLGDLNKGGVTALLMVFTYVLTYGRSEIDLSEKMRPNEGIKQTAKSGAIIGSILGIPVAVLINVRYGLIIGILGMLFYGGIAFTLHYFLRLLLYKYDYLPWKLSQFLEDMASLTLLQKVGGGYKFLHNTLRDHLAHSQDI